MLNAPQTDSEIAKPELKVPRYFFEIAYRGTHYAGWQSQPNAVGVQQVVENALSILLREKIEIVGSGRTDTGVHCEQQYFHADLPNTANVPELRRKLNSFLPADIAIGNIRRVIPEAHARFSALSRSYQYRIVTEKNPFMEERALYWFKPLHLQTLNEASALITGLHDFESFSKVNTDVNNFRCDVKAAYWEHQDHQIIFHITANRFLRGMVRALVGTLLDVGVGKMSVRDFQQVVEQRDRRKAGMNVEPHGLYLTSVHYPPEIFIEN